MALFERLVAAADADNNSIKNTFQRFNPFCLPPFKSTAATDTQLLKKPLAIINRNDFYIDFKIKLRNVYRHGKEFFRCDYNRFKLISLFIFFLVKGTIGWRITWDLVTPEEGDDVIAVYYKSPDVEKEDKLKRGERRVFFFVSSSHTHTHKRWRSDPLHMPPPLVVWLCQCQ